jgi:hypothetical protein
MFFLVFLFVAALPRYLTSPWFDDEYVGSLQGKGLPGKTPIRLKLMDSSPIDFMGENQWAVMTVSSEHGKPVPQDLSGKCIMRSVVFSAPERAEIELAPSRSCPHAAFPVTFDGFSKVKIDLGGGRFIEADRDFRRNPLHLATEWIKWRFAAQAGVFFNSKGL